MRARLSHLILILAGLGLSACARAPEHVALDIAARNNVNSTDIVAPVRQGEVYVFVPPAGAPGGGLLGALIGVGIDSVRTSKAEDAVKPLRDAVIDFNFDDLLREDLKASMSKVQWLNVTDVKVIKDVATASLDSAITGSKASAVLMVAADYHLSNDGVTFSIAVRANLFPNSHALTPPKATDASAKPKSDQTNAIYRNVFTFQAKVPGATDDRDRNMATWAANHGALLRAATTKGAAKLTELLAADIQQAPLGTAEQGEKVLSNGPDGVLTRLANGTLTFVAD